MNLSPATIDSFKSVSKPQKAKPVKKMDEKNPFVLVDECPRSQLNEGRNYGMGFAFCKRNGNTFTTVQPLSPCKDYLNDIVYSERTGKPYSAYGLYAEKKDIFDTNAYLVFGILEYKSGGKYGQYDRDFKLLNENVEKLQAFINEWETLLKVEGRTRLVKIKENRVLSIAPLFWSQYTYLISLYSLLLRNGIHYKGGNVVDFLKQCKDDAGDSGVIGYCREKVDKLINQGIPFQDLKQIYSPHGLGLASFNW